MRLKIDPKTMRKRASKKWSKNGQKWSQNGTKMEPKCINNRLKMRAKKKIDERAGNKLQKSESQTIDQLNKKIDRCVFKGNMLECLEYLKSWDSANDSQNINPLINWESIICGYFVKERAWRF